MRGDLDDAKSNVRREYLPGEEIQLSPVFARQTSSATKCLKSFVIDFYKVFCVTTRSCFCSVRTNERYDGNRSPKPL